MKTAAIWILSLAILLACIATQAHSQSIPDAELDKISREDIAKTLRHLKAISKEAQSRADEAEAHEAKTLGALQAMTRKNIELEVALVTADKTARELEAHDAAAVAYGAQEHERAGKMEIRAVKAEKRNVILAVIAGGALLACAALTYLLFKP